VSDIRDETSVEDPAVWLVWDDSDYYGPDLVAVCHDRSNALRNAAEQIKGGTKPDHIYIEGIEYD
jgi:hypothetical protein